MTESQHLKISRQLALAIGWKPELMLADSGFLWIDIEPNEAFTWWSKFDYRDWSVIGPIAERFDCFPHRYGDKWETTDADANSYFADTPQLAIALAFIADKGVK